MIVQPSFPCRNLSGSIDENESSASYQLVLEEDTSFVEGERLDCGYRPVYLRFTLGSWGPTHNPSDAGMRSTFGQTLAMRSISQIHRLHSTAHLTLGSPTKAHSGTLTSSPMWYVRQEHRSPDVFRE